MLCEINPLHASQNQRKENEKHHVATKRTLILIHAQTLSSSWVNFFGALRGGEPTECGNERRVWGVELGFAQQSLFFFLLTVRFVHFSAHIDDNQTTLVRPFAAMSF
jgi:hypothetical protein